MPRRPNISSQTRSVMAALLAAHPDWSHGYGLGRTAKLQSGTLAPLLRRLHASGLLEDEWGPSLHPGRPLRHLYRLSAAGLKLAREQGKAEADKGKKTTRPPSAP